MEKSQCDTVSSAKIIIKFVTIPFYSPENRLALAFPRNVARQCQNQKSFNSFLISAFKMLKEL